MLHKYLRTAEHPTDKIELSILLHIKFLKQTVSIFSMSKMLQQKQNQALLYYPISAYHTKPICLDLCWQKLHTFLHEFIHNGYAALLGLALSTFVVEYL